MKSSQVIFKSSAGQCKICRWGNRLRGWLNSDDGYHHVGKYGCGWKDGGCHLLAHALKRHLGDEARMGSLASNAYPKGGEHSFVHFRGHVIDADGAHQGRKYMTQKFGTDHGRYRITKFRPRAAIDAATGSLFGPDSPRGALMPHSGKECRYLSNQIARKVGHPDGY